MIHNRYLRDNVFFEQLVLLSEYAILRVRTSDTMAGREMFQRYSTRRSRNLPKAQLSFFHADLSPRGEELHLAEFADVLARHAVRDLILITRLINGMEVYRCVCCLAVDKIHMHTVEYARR